MRDGKNDLTDSELILPPQVRSFFWFHVYFTVRRILFELGGVQNSLALPGDSAFSQTENKYDIPSFERICAEFGISPNADFRFTRGDNHGLGSVFEYFTNSGYIKTPYEYPSKETKFEDEGGRASDGNLVPYIENTEARNQYEYFLCPVSHGLTSAGLSRINQSIESFCFAILGSQVDVRSSIAGSQGSSGRFKLIPDFTLDYSSSNSLAVEVDDDNRKLFEDFEEKIQSEAGDEVELIKYGCVYLKIYLNDEGKMVPKFWKVFEKNGKEYKKAILNKDSLDWKNIEGEIVFSIANIFVEEYTKSEDMTEPKSIICVAKEILVREIMDEKSYFNIPVGEDSDDEMED